MKNYLVAAIALLVLTASAAAQTTNGLCMADAKGPNWYTKMELVFRDGKPQGATQFISGSGAAKTTDITEFSSGNGVKQGWLRLEFSQDLRGRRAAITVFAPGMAKDEMISSYRLTLKVGETVIAEAAAEDDGFYAGWATGTTKILTFTLKDVSVVGPALRALDRADSVTVETVGVLLDKSRSKAATFTVSAQALRASRDAAPEVKTKVETAARSGTCPPLK